MRVSDQESGPYYSITVIYAFVNQPQDWYCCNIGSVSGNICVFRFTCLTLALGSQSPCSAFHVRAARDSMVAVADDKLLQGWLLSEHQVVVRAAAIAVGNADELKALVKRFVKAGEPTKAAKATWALMTVLNASALEFKRGGEEALEARQYEDAALKLLHESGETSDEVLQLELGEIQVARLF